MTTLLITGAGGFLGSHILDSALRWTDWDIICLDSFHHNGLQDRIRAVTRVQSDESVARVHVIAHDMRSLVSALTATTEIDEAQYIVNAASLCQVDQSISEPVAFISNNVQTVLTALELARDLCPEHFIHMSTDEVYGPHKPFSPNDHWPSSPYSASKAAQEDICHAYAATYDVPVTIINSANIFGERQSMLAFVPKALRAILGRETLPIHTARGEPARRRMSYAGNVAKFIVDHLTNNAGGREPLPGQCELSVLELAQKIADLVGMPLKYQLMEGVVVRPGFDRSYAPLEGSWNPEISFDDGLERTVRWALANREWIDK